MQILPSSRLSPSLSIAAVAFLLGAINCSTKSDSLGAAGQQDAAIVVDAAKQVDSVVAVDAAKQVDSAVAVDAAKLVDAAIAVDATKVVDSAVAVDATKLMDSAIAVDATKVVDSAVAVDVDRPTDTPVVQDAGGAVDTRSETNPVTCNYNGVVYPVGAVLKLSSCTTCMCLTTGSLGNCTGLCTPDAAVDATVLVDAQTSQDAAGLAALCTGTGGTVSPSLCCESASDFPNMCMPGPCGCAPSSSHTINTCTCPGNACFDPAYGCTGPAGVCTVGMDQTCNDNLALSSVHGRCLTGGRCQCDAGYTLLASGKCS